MPSSREDPFEPVEINGMSLDNRFVRSATWLGLCDDGFVTDRVVERYRELSFGGPGAIVTGIVTVSPTEVPLLGMADLSDDRFIEGHRRLVEAIHEGGSKAIVQLAISSYGVEEGGWFIEKEVDDLRDSDMGRIVALFGEAAVRAVRAGYDGIQIHVAHFFFLSRCVSPLVNHRTDVYGGTAANRARLVAGIVAEVRSRLGSGYPILAKVNGTDDHTGGISKEDLLVLCRVLEDSGIDAVEVSGNNTSRRGIAPGRGEGYFMEYAKAVKRGTGLKVIGVGGFRSIDAVTAALGSIDMVSISRPLIREPDLIARWRNGYRGPSACVSCNACYSTPGHVCRFSR